VSEPQSYEIVQSERGFEVFSPGGYSAVICNSKAAAEQYLVLLNQAFSLGFKSGFRSARQDSEDSED
jgi:hypothetical protein